MIKNFIQSLHGRVHRVRDGSVVGHNGSVIKWMDLIDNSFLADDLKKQYKRLILKRLLLLR